MFVRRKLLELTHVRLKIESTTINTHLDAMFAWRRSTQQPLAKVPKSSKSSKVPKAPKSPKAP